MLDVVLPHLSLCICGHLTPALGTITEPGDTGVPPSRIDALALVGGAARIPSFQSALRAELLKQDKLESGGLDGDEALVHGALLFAISRNEPNALGRSIAVVEDSEKWAPQLAAAEVALATAGDIRLLATSSSARKAAEAQIFALRERSAAVAALAAAHDRLERFVFKLVAKYSAKGEEFPSAAAETELAALQRWLTPADDDEEEGRSEEEREGEDSANAATTAVLAERLAALEAVFPEDAKAEQAPPSPPPPVKKKSAIPAVLLPKDEVSGGGGLRLPRGLVVGDEFILSGYTPSKAKKPLGVFDIALTSKDGYFVGDVALRYWVREDGDGVTPPARGISRMAKVGGEWTADEGEADTVRPPQFERGNAFQMRIMVAKDHYTISVGGAGDSGGGHRCVAVHLSPQSVLTMLWCWSDAPRH